MPTPEAPAAPPPQGGATSGPAKPVPRWPARIVAYAVAVMVLAGVFALYAQPRIMVAVADMIWACFH